MIKALSTLGREWNFLNLLKNIHEKPTVNHTINDKRLKGFPPTSGKCPLPPFLVNIVQEVLTKAIRQERKGTAIRSKIPFAAVLILYIKNPKENTYMHNY